MLATDAAVLGLVGVLGACGCERGEGSARVCPAPRPDDPAAFTGDVTAISGAASDAWAIGARRYSDGTFDRQVLIHWDGCDWRQETTPFDATPREHLQALSASGRDVWLSGGEIQGGDPSYGTRCPPAGGRVFRRRDGRWQPIDRSSTGARYVFAIWANASGDAWMLERPCDTYGYLSPAVRHWDGKAVVDVGAPQEIRAAGVLWSSGPRDAWVGGEGGVAHCDGTAWRSFPIEKERIWFIAGGGASDLWASGTRIQHWDGKRWTEPSQPALMQRGRPGSILSLGALPGGHTFVTDVDGNIYRSERETLPVIGRIRSATGGLPSSPWWWLGFVGGRDDLILFLDKQIHRPAMRWSNRTWTVQAPEFTGQKGEDVVALWADGAATVWAAVSFRFAPGNRAGEIRRWTGTTWERAAMLEQFPNRFWGLAPDDVWLVGMGGASWHWDGRRWKSVATGAAEHLFGVWGSGPKDVWAGGPGTVLRWDGAAWRRWSTLNAVENSASVAALGGVGADLVLAVDGPHVVRWDGRGWVPSDGRNDVIGQNTHAALIGVWASSPHDIWLVGTGGDVQESYDRRSSTVLPTPLIVHGDGRDWKRVVVGLGSRLRAITGTAANDVWTVGEEGTVLHWNGNEWSSIKSGTEANLLAVAKAADGSVWIGGEGGFLRRLP
jgi:hypothetical protein